MSKVPLEFARGLFAYLRQAALSVHRAPAAFFDPLLRFHRHRKLPDPRRVLLRLDQMTSAAKVLRPLFAVRMTQNELAVTREGLLALAAILEQSVDESEAEKIRLRLILSRAESLMRRKLGKAASRVEMVEHLNAAEHLVLRSFAELAGSGWPDSLH